MRSEIAGLRPEVQAEFQTETASLRAEIKSESASLRAEIQGKVPPGDPK
jgi:hypothetical protein